MFTDLSKSSFNQIMDLVNLSNIQNEADLTSSLVSLQDITVLEEGTKNTSVRIAALPNTKYTGDVTVEYNRLDLQDFETNYGLSKLILNEEATLTDVINAFNSYFGANLSVGIDIDETIVVPEIEYTPANLILVAKANSPAYFGDIEVEVGKLTTELSVIIPSLVLNGLNFPIPPGPLLTANFTSKATDNTGRSSAASAVIGDYFYVAGGRIGGGTAPNTVRRYDIINNTWSSMASLGGAPRADTAGVAIAGKFYVYGGATNNQVCVYNPGNNQWTYINGTNAPSVSRQNMRIVTDGTYMYVHGGRQTAITAALSELWRYNPTTETWNQLTSSPVDMTHHQLVYFDGNIYAMGGSAGQVNEYVGVSIFYRYNIASDSWVQLPNAPFSRALGCAFEIGRRLYFYGGTTTGSPGGTHSALWVYTPDEDTWENLGDVGDPRSDFMFGVYNNKLLVNGGKLINTYLNTTEEIY